MFCRVRLPVISCDGATQQRKKTLVSSSSSRHAYHPRPNPSPSPHLLLYLLIQRTTQTYSRVNQVLQDLLVNLLESSTPRALLLHSRNSRRLSHHTTLSNENDVTVRELLLEFSRQSIGCGGGIVWERGCSWFEYRLCWEAKCRHW